MSPAAACLDGAFQTFRGAYPAFSSTGHLDELRASEYARLDRTDHVYLDHAGGSLYAASQLREHHALLAEGVFGNPHSGSPAASASTDLADRVRRRVLDHFHASPDEYAVVFTANASGATVSYVPHTPPDLRVEDSTLDRYLDRARSRSGNLFAYPAQSNFSGVQHPLDWIERAQSRGWDVLLDAAAFVPTNVLDLARYKPDYVDLSFYKMFGYPTGAGCLIARRKALSRLRRPWFAGGTIAVASVLAGRHSLAEGEAAFEDGTIDYLCLPAVEIGLRHLESIGLHAIHERVRCLAGWLLDRLPALRHGNGRPLVRLYGPATTEARGGTVTLNFLDADGRVLDHRAIESRAAAAKISVRTGCFCNPGGAETAFGITAEEISACFRHAGGGPLTHDVLTRCINGKPTGAVRVSLGLASNFADVERFLEFAGSLREPLP